MEQSETSKRLSTGQPLATLSQTETAKESSREQSENVDPLKSEDKSDLVTFT